MKQRKKLLEENAKRLLGTRRKGATNRTLIQQKEPTIIPLKNLEGNKNKNKEDNSAVDSNLLVDEINKIALMLIDSEKGSCDDFETIYKYAKDHAKDNFFIELMTDPADIQIGLQKQNDMKFRDNFNNYIDLLFQEVASQAKDIKSCDHNFFTNFKYLLNLMLRCLVHLSPNTGAYSSYLKMMQTFGEEMAHDSNCSPILFLESIGLEYLLEFAKKYSNKKDALVHIMMSICPQGDQMHIRLLKRIEKMVGSDSRTLSAILAHMSAYQAMEGFEGEIFDFFWTKAIYFLEFPCPKIRTNGLKILNEISRFDYTKMPSCYAHLRIQCSEVWWETKAQILIICANQLEVIEMAHQEETSRYASLTLEKIIDPICTILKSMEKRLWREPSPRSNPKIDPSRWNKQTRIQGPTPIDLRSMNLKRPTIAREDWLLRQVISLCRGKLRSFIYLTWFPESSTKMPMSMFRRWA